MRVAIGPATFTAGDPAWHRVGPVEVDESVLGIPAELHEALQPFVKHNSSAEWITVTVRTDDITRARAALATQMKRVEGA